MKINTINPDHEVLSVRSPRVSVRAWARATSIMKEEAPCETWIKKAYKKVDPSFLKVYINGKPHFKIFSVQPASGNCVKFVVSDDTLRVARACGFRLTKDQNWIIQKTEDGLNHSLTRLLGRTVRMGRIY
jgi:hypothetical protein